MLAHPTTFVVWYSLCTPRDSSPPSWHPSRNGKGGHDQADHLRPRPGDVHDSGERAAPPKLIWPQSARNTSLQDRCEDADRSAAAIRAAQPEQDRPPGRRPCTHTWRNRSPASVTRSCAGRHSDADRRYPVGEFGVRSGITSDGRSSKSASRSPAAQATSKKAPVARSGEPRGMPSLAAHRPGSRRSSRPAQSGTGRVGGQRAAGGAAAPKPSARLAQTAHEGTLNGR